MRPVAGGDDTVIRIENLHVEYPNEYAVRGVSLTIPAHRVVALVGESGSGKSVTARSLLGLAGEAARVRADVLRLGNEDLLTVSPNRWRELRGGHIGLVTQDALGSLDPLRRIGAEVAEPLRIHRVVPRGEVAAQVRDLLESAGIPDAGRRAQQFPYQLSGGLRQRALIASALAGDPRLLIADEPTTALDVTVGKRILQLLRDRAAAGTAVLLISHDLAVVSDIADYVYVMKDGKIVEGGTPDGVFRNPSHPYTEQLLAAIPTRASRGQRLSSRGSAREAISPKSASTGPPLMSVDHLSKQFRGRRRADRIDAAVDVSFEIRSGETIGLVGESGSGKSTVGRIVVGLTEPDSGSIEFEGRPRSRRTRADRARIQMIYQDSFASFDPRYSGRQVLGEAVAQRKALRAEPSFVGTDSDAEPLQPGQYADHILDVVGLTDSQLAKPTRELSGGQRQRLAIARALVIEPRIIVCDEVVSALDVSIQAQVLDLLTDVQQQLGVAYLFISHDLGVVQHIADHVMVMQAGRVVESGLAAKVFDSPNHPYTHELLAAVPGRRSRQSSSAINSV